MTIGTAVRLAQQGPQQPLCGLGAVRGRPDHGDERTRARERPEQHSPVDLVTFLGHPAWVRGVGAELARGGVIRLHDTADASGEIRRQATPGGGWMMCHQC